MITWLHNYIEKTTTNKPNGSISTINYLDLHRTFYSLCQTVFYIIIFRNRQLFQPHHVSQNNHHHPEKNKEKDYSNLVRTWKLNELVTSKLNPLRYCLRSIRKKFARIAYINQIAYCYSIIDANNRLTIPISGQSSKQNLNGMFFSNQNDSLFLKEASCDANKLNKKSIEKRFDSNAIADNPLDSFFPFDPYLLSRSRIYVVKYYQEFQNVIDDDMELDDDDNESDSDDDDDDDDDEDDEDEDEEEEDELEDDTTEDEKNIRNDLERELRDDSDNDDENKKNLKLNRFTFNKNSNLYSNDEDD
jgi:RNA polymerase I-specific transcription initiation factor RRN3